MKSERWQQIDDLFQAAVEREPGQRSAFLEEACGGDEALRSEVESLIASYEQDESFIETPAFEVAAPLFSDEPNGLSAGQLVGHYKVLGPVGAGGMGEVYLAEDTRLGRKVALKLLPAFFTGDRDRLRRFEQEARAASALNHPNILTIHEVGQADGRHFIATEFIEGETLRQRASRGGVNITELLNVAEQVASALAAAHASGIIHRDIKPENIMVRPDGYVKVLDFGLVKLTKGLAGAPARGLSVTGTSPGVVMGTARYMSPEQARGLEVDARTDVWSLGVVLYEMLAGRPPFGGETPSDVLAAVLEREPPPPSHYAEVPGALEWIITKALTKDRDERYQTASEMLADLRRLRRRLDVAAELELSSAPDAAREEGVSEGVPKDGPRPNVIAEEQATARIRQTPTARTKSGIQSFVSGIRSRRSLSPALVAIVALLAALGFAFLKYRGGLWSEAVPQTEPGANQSFLPGRSKQLTTWSGLDIYPALSPDGNSVAYSSDHGESFEIYVKQLAPGGREIQLTSDGGQNFQPAWSPDGQLIAYHSRNRGGIWLIPALGGDARQLTEFGSCPAWSPDGSVIAFQQDKLTDLGQTSTGAAPPSTLWSVPARGGAPKRLTQPGDPPGGHGSPSWSPDGRRIVFTSSNVGVTQIWSVSAGGGGLKQLSKQPGFLHDPVYSHDGGSIYYAGSPNGLALVKLHVSPEGDPVGEPVIVKSTENRLYKHLRISADGTKMVYASVALNSNLWSAPLSPDTFEAKGAPVQLTQDTSRRKSFPAFSPDGRKIAFTALREGAAHDIWVMDADGKNITQLTTDPASDIFPGWFPEGDRIVFMSQRGGRTALWAFSLRSRAEQPLLEFDQDAAYTQLSPDGKQVAFNSIKDGTINVWVASLAGGGQPRQLTFDQELMGFPCWSPDSRLLAFQMKRGDDTYIAVMPAGGGEPVRLTSERGQSWTGSWSPDGERIAFAGQREGFWNVWWVSREDGRQKQVTNYNKLNAYVRYVAWSPLGNQIVYEYAETTGNIWMVDLK